MTVGPDLDWLADDTGDLRPDVAQQLLAAPGEPLAQAPPVPEPPQNPREQQVAPAREPRRQPLTAATAQVRRPAAARNVEVPAGATAGGMIRLPWWIVAVVAASAVAGGIVGRWTPASHRYGEQTASISALPGAAVPAAMVNGVNVYLRSGPGLAYPIVARLLNGEGLRVGAERDGWYAVTSAGGITGFVFGAFVRGAPGGNRGSARVTRPLISDGTPQVVLRTGDKVFLIREADGQLVVTLPTGRQLRVSPNDVAFLD